MSTDNFEAGNLGVELCIEEQARIEQRALGAALDCVVETFAVRISVATEGDLDGASSWLWVFEKGGHWRSCVHHPAPEVAHLTLDTSTYLAWRAGVIDGRDLLRDALGFDGSLEGMIFVGGLMAHPTIQRICGP